MEMLKLFFFIIAVSCYGCDAHVLPVDGSRTNGHNHVRSNSDDRGALSDLGTIDMVAGMMKSLQDLPNMSFQGQMTLPPFRQLIFPQMQFPPMRPLYFPPMNFPPFPPMKFAPFPPMKFPPFPPMNFPPFPPMYFPPIKPLVFKPFPPLLPMMPILPMPFPPLPSLNGMRSIDSGDIASVLSRPGGFISGVASSLFTTFDNAGGRPHTEGFFLQNINGRIKSVSWEDPPDDNDQNKSSDDKP
ncbi:seroin-like [Pectinophora gossypiella]|uniref:seroin-like n=1 Tax=Pectinophora gossypiella TaxID=13191 RepID=UPI00214DFAF7|nr:seroin-like [Pectinophora gossypiella]